MAIRARHIRVEVGPVPKKREAGVIYFASFEEMSRVLTPNRVELLEAIRKESPESIYELAQLVGRDQGNVTKDVSLLEEHGFVDIVRTKDGNRTRSQPQVEGEVIEMVIRLGAGAFGIAKEIAEGVSEEFKGKRLEENTRYAKDTARGAIEPVRKAARSVAKAVADELDIATKDESRRKGKEKE